MNKLRLSSISTKYIIVIFLALYSLFVVLNAIRKKNVFYQKVNYAVGNPYKKSYSGKTKRKVNYSYIDNTGILNYDRSDWPYNVEIDLDRNYLIIYGQYEPRSSFLIYDVPIEAKLGDIVDSSLFSINIEIPWYKF